MKMFFILIIFIYSACNTFSLINIGYLLTLENDTSTISNYDIEKYNFKYDNCKNIDKIDFNLLVKTSDLFTFQPFTKIYDLTWSVDRESKGKFSEINIMPGVGFNFKFNESISLLSWFANLDKFLELSGFWNGFNIGAQVNIIKEKQYLMLMFKDELLPLFLYDYKVTHRYNLINIFSYLIVFNCFNYINEKVNSGIYFQGKLEIEAGYFNFKYLSTRFTNNLFIGFSFNPHKIFKCYIAYAMINTQIINYNGNLTSNKWNIGLRTGVYFYPKWFAIQVYYMPFFFNYSNSQTNKMTHIIGASLTFTLK